MSNRLISEHSPYLRQHGENPVDWYPWGDEAFDRARREDKPVFLSIGYSTCHWCHVMAEESFENPEVASILNGYFVSVKVDREERPDVDSVYMQACTALNGSGGWPLTVVMTPEQMPFYVGTYLPRRGRYGQMGLMELLTAIASKWENDREELLRVAAGVTSFLTEERRPGEKAENLPKKAAKQLMDSYDKEYGGFGKAPKFPSAHNLIFLMEQSRFGGDKKLRQAVENTLRQMYRGGIYDHLGGGFCRYSTDREWLAPHFEKTLYDNAMLALCYTEAWQDGHMALYRTVAEDTLDYCLRELKAHDGGFFCGQDADSEGTEGAYYLLSEDEVRSVLGEEHGRHFCECYDITKEGNFEGKSIPNLLLNNRWNFVPEGYDEFREKLRIYREERMPLFTDTKILSSWNGLMLMALSRASRAFGDRRYFMEAEELAAFIDSALYKDGRLMARLSDGDLRFDAGLDAHAFTALGMLELYDADFNAEHIVRAAELANEILSRFPDENGGFFSTAEDSEKLIIRPKEVFDGAMPSGNSAAAVMFDRLFRLTGNIKWRDASDKQADFVARSVGEYPAGCSYALTAEVIRQAGTKEIVCVLPDADMPSELKALLSRWEPELTVILKTKENADTLSELAPFTSEMTVKDGKPTYYVCSGGQCGLPMTY